MKLRFMSISSEVWVKTLQQLLDEGQFRALFVLQTLNNIIESSVCLKGLDISKLLDECAEGYDGAPGVILGYLQAGATYDKKSINGMHPLLLALNIGMLDANCK